MAKKSTRAPARRGNKMLAYYRVSDITGREDTLISDEVQSAQCHSYAKRENLVIVDEITELGKSGRTSEKRAIADIIDRVRAGEIDGVIVWKISRWGRNTIDSSLNILELQEAGGYILSATENLDDVETPVGKFSLTLLLALAEMYSDEIGKTWSNIHDYRRDNGKTSHGTARLGYTRENDQYTPDLATSPWLRSAFEWYVSGVSFTEIVRRFDAAGIRSTRGKNITYKSLMSSMDGGFAAGLIVDRRGGGIEYTPGTHTALIPTDMWDRYLRRRSSTVAPRIKSAPYRLAGLVRCATCGDAMSAERRPQSAGGGRYFRCNKGKRTLRTVFCDAPATISEMLVEAAVLAWITENSEGQSRLDTVIARAARVDQMQVDIKRIDREIEKAQKRLGFLTDKVLDGTISDEAYKIKEAQMEAEIAHLRASKEQSGVEVATNSMPAQTAFGAVLKGWELLDPAVLNEGLRQVVRRVAVTKSPQFGGHAAIRVIGTWESSSGSLPSV